MARSASPSTGSPAAVLLTVPGAPLTRAAAQVVGALAVLSVSAALTVDVVSGAVMTLVLGGVTLARVLALPGVLQALLGAALLAAAWASVFGWYVTHTWVDVPAHLFVTGLLAAAGGVTMQRAGMLADAGTRAGRAGVAVTTAAVGVALGVVWEVAEWVGFRFIDESVYVYYEDTIGDLVAGTVGSVVAGVLVARWAR